MIVFPSQRHEHELVRAVGNAAKFVVMDAANGLRSGGLALTLHVRDDAQVCVEFTVRWFEREAPESAAR